MSTARLLFCFVLRVSEALLDFFLSLFCSSSFVCILVHLFLFACVSFACLVRISLAHVRACVSVCVHVRIYVH